MTSVSVLTCVNENHIRPSVSKAKIRETLGTTCFSLNVLGASEGTHVFLRCRVLFSQLSSTLMIRRPDSNIGKIFREYCCRRTSDLSRLL